MMRRRVLCIVPYPTEGASARLRVEQFMPYLKDAGIDCVVRPFLTSGFYAILYKRGNVMRKIAYFLACAFRRFVDIARSFYFDAVLIHREAFPLGPPFLEALLFLFRRRVIFDFDDAIYLPSQGGNYGAAILKCPRKTDFIIRHSDAVIAGNDYLRDYARRFNSAITVIPTCIDANRYRRSVRRAVSEEVVVGWIGSHTTQVFLDELEGIFLTLLAKYRNLKIRLVGGRLNALAHSRMYAKRWSLEDELHDLQGFDIGIMPMPDDEWTRGKCAFKAILYMGCGIPVVASRVGVNTEVIEDGVSGFLVTGEYEWTEKLSLLIENRRLRDQLGQRGREKVVERYSLSGAAPVLVRILDTVCKKGDMVRNGL